MRRILVSIVILIVVLSYFAFAPRELAKTWLFFPVKTQSYHTLHERMWGAIGHHAQFRTKSGVLIHGLYLVKPKSKYTFLLHYGQGGNISTNIGLAKMPLAAGQSVFAYDYEGYGMSQGIPSLKAISEDGLAAYDYLIEKEGLKPNQIVQYGVSLGTGVACHVAESRKSAGVVLFSPYTSIFKAAKERLPHLYLYPQFMFPAPDIGALSFVSRDKKTPLFVWHGKRDIVIGVSHSQELSNYAGENVQFLIEPDKHHGDWSINEIAEKIKDFLNTIPESKSMAPEFAHQKSP